MAWFSRRRVIPDGLWMRCDACGQMVYKREVEQALWVCPKCQYHFSLSAPQRMRFVLDDKTFQEADPALAPTDPLALPRRAGPGRRRRRRSRRRAPQEFPRHGPLGADRRHRRKRRGDHHLHAAGQSDRVARPGPCRDH